MAVVVSGWLLFPLSSSAQTLIAMIGPAPVRKIQPSFHLSLPAITAHSSLKVSNDDQHWINRFVTWMTTNPAPYSVGANAYWLSGGSLEFVSRHKTATGNVRFGCGFAMGMHFNPGAMASITYEVF